MRISFDKLPNAGKTFPVYLVKRLYVMSNSVLKIKYILLNVYLMNHAIIEYLLGIHVYATAR